MGFSNENNGFTMPVQPMYGNGNGSGNGFGFGGDGAWWLLVLLRLTLQEVVALQSHLRTHQKQQNQYLYATLMSLLQESDERS